MNNNNSADEAIRKIKSVAEDPRITMDRLYKAYEEMCFRNPMLDMDDIYPRSYQWRSVDRYNLAKLAVLTEAVKQGRMIVETGAYQDYVRAEARHELSHMTWE